MVDWRQEEYREDGLGGGRLRVLFLRRDGGGGNLSYSLVHVHTQDDSGMCTYGWDAGTLGHWLESLLPYFPGSAGNGKSGEPV